jgi:hypothetical protein
MKGRQDGNVSGQGHRRAGDALAEDHAVARQFVEAWRDGASLTDGSHVIGSQGIEGDQ